MPPVSEKSASPPADAAAELARKIAHELNSPLDGVMRFVSLAQRKLADKNQNAADIARYLADAEFGLQRIVEILRDLTDVTRAPLLENSGAIELSILIEQVVSTHTPAAERCRVILQTDPLPVSAPRVDSRLYQVLSNLVKNAIEAMPEGGTVTIAAQITPDPPPPAARARASAQGTLSITITDTGPGIAPQQQQNLFTQNFTTKSPGRGTGLSLSRDILQKLGGTLALSNRPTGTGCRAAVTLPI